MNTEHQSKVGNGGNKVTQTLAPSSANGNAEKETELKKKLLSWADEIADKLIEAALADAALKFSDRELDGEELGSLDLKGEYDPIVADDTGATLSDVVKDVAAEFRQSEQALKRLYTSALKRKWKDQNKEIPTDPNGTKYGSSSFVSNRHGVWARFYFVGSGGPYVWRRICRTWIDLYALSRDTTPPRNVRHVYRIADETGRFSVEIDAAHLAEKANRAISELMPHGVHVVEAKEARQQLAKFLRLRPTHRILRAPTTGWFNAPNGRWVVVLPTETLGDAGKGPPQSAPEPHLGKSGVAGHTAQRTVYAGSSNLRHRRGEHGWWSLIIATGVASLALNRNRRPKNVPGAGAYLFSRRRPCSRGHATISESMRAHSPAIVGAACSPGGT